MKQLRFLAFAVAMLLTVSTGYMAVSAASSSYNAGVTITFEDSRSSRPDESSKDESSKDESSKDESSKDESSRNDGSSSSPDIYVSQPDVWRPGGDGGGSTGGGGSSSSGWRDTSRTPNFNRGGGGGGTADTVTILDPDVPLAGLGDLPKTGGWPMIPQLLLTLGAWVLYIGLRWEPKAGPRQALC